MQNNNYELKTQNYERDFEFNFGTLMSNKNPTTNISTTTKIEVRMDPVMSSRLANRHMPSTIAIFSSTS